MNQHKYLEIDQKNTAPKEHIATIVGASIIFGSGLLMIAGIIFGLDSIISPSDQEIIGQASGLLEYSVLIFITGLAIAAGLLLSLRQYTLEKVGVLYLEKPGELPADLRKDYEEIIITRSVIQTANTLELAPTQTKEQLQARKQYFRTQRRRALGKEVHASLLWVGKLLLPAFIYQEPSLWENLKTIGTDRKFRTFRIMIIVWGSLAVALFLAIARTISTF